MKLVKFVKKMKENSDKKNVLVSQGFEPVTFPSFHKTLPTEPRAQCDIQMVSIDKILTFEKVLKQKWREGHGCLLHQTSLQNTSYLAHFSMDLKSVNINFTQF